MLYSPATAAFCLLLALCPQGAVQSGSYSLVSTGQELVDQLSNSSARYIKVVNDITLPGDLPSGAVTVNR